MCVGGECVCVGGECVGVVVSVCCWVNGESEIRD